MASGRRTALGADVGTTVLLSRQTNSNTPHREKVVDSTGEHVLKGQYGEVAVAILRTNDAASGSGDPLAHCTEIALVTVTPAAPFFFGTKDATTV